MILVVLKCLYILVCRSKSPTGRMLHAVQHSTQNRISMSMSMIVAAIESACVLLCVDLGICTLDVGLVKLVIDCSSVLAVHPEVHVSQIQTIQFHRTLLCFALHSLRFNKLGFVPKCKRRGQAKNL